jgi:hypothetical protein
MELRFSQDSLRESIQNLNTSFARGEKFAITDNTSWYGVDNLDGFYSKSLFDSVVLNTFTILPNVKSKEKIGLFDMGNTLQPFDSTTFTPSSAYLSQKTITVDKFKVNIELEQKQLENNYLSEMAKAGSPGNIAPADFLSYVLDLTARQIQNDFEYLAFSGGVAGLTGSYPNALSTGLIAKATADANTIKVSATASINETNVIAEMTKVYKSIPTTIINKKDLKIYVAADVAKAYRVAIALANNANSMYITENILPFNYLGIPMIEAKGMPNSKMFVARGANVFYATDKSSDAQSLNVINTWNTIGTSTLRIVSSFNFGVDYAVSSEIVVYA